MTAGYGWRTAVMADLAALRALMHEAIERLQGDFLTPAQVRASHRVMGLDTQLIRDGTYLVVTSGDAIAGCGGWSYRATLYGGDASVVARDAAVLDPLTDAARIRAMYTAPAHARRGVGRLILGLCEDEARRHGFRRARMMATMAGVPLYRACGYHAVERAETRPEGGEVVPLVVMEKSLEQPGAVPDRRHDPVAGGDGEGG